MVKKIDHINIVVKNLNEAKAFFLKIGFTLQHEGILEGDWIDTLTGLVNVKAEYVGLSLENSETNLELLQFYHPIGKRDENAYSFNQMGFRHMAFEVSNIENVVKKLKKEGVKFFSKIQEYKGANKKLCYFQGPEGIVLELAEY